MPQWINWVGAGAGLCGIAGFAPQIAKILRERETHAISFRMYLLATTGFTLWVIYGLAQNSWPIVAANGVMLAMAATILILKLKFNDDHLPLPYVIDPSISVRSSTATANGSNSNSLQLTVPTGVGVIIDTNGQLGTVVSSERFKDAVKPMDYASEAILALKPVTFRYKHDLDPDAIPQFGLIAEEVDKVNPDLVVRDGDGKVMTVRYEAVNAMLLNEFLKEHRHVEEQAGEIEQMKKQMQALTATVRKVSDQIEVDHSRSQTLVSNESR